MTLFSAGGADNADVPEGSSYRSATPMAWTIMDRRGASTATPWPIAYQACNHPMRNGFFQRPAEIEFRAA